MNGLAAAGYSVTGGTAGAWVEALFTARTVPWVTLTADVRRAQAVIDRLLNVS